MRTIITLDDLRRHVIELWGGGRGQPAGAERGTVGVQFPQRDQRPGTTGASHQ